MEVIVKALGAFVLLIFVSSVGGLILWGTWDVLLTLFPLLEGYGVTKEIELWNAIKLSWLCGVIFGKVIFGKVNSNSSSNSSSN